MKVKELMDMLKKYDENDEVEFEIYDDGDVIIYGFGSQYVMMEINEKPIIRVD